MKKEDTMKQTKKEYWENWDESSPRKTTRIEISHCQQCGKPCPVVHELELSACCYAVVVWKTPVAGGE